MNGIVHTWCVKGNLEKNHGVLTYKVPTFEVKYNSWQISVGEILIKIVSKKQAILNKVITLSCNFFRDTNYNQTNEIGFCYPILNYILLKSIKAEDQFIIVRPDKTWHCLNNFEDHLKLFFCDSSDETKCEENVDVQVLLHFQQVK